MPIRLRGAEEYWVAVVVVETPDDDVTQVWIRDVDDDVLEVWDKAQRALQDELGIDPGAVLADPMTAITNASAKATPEVQRKLRQQTKEAALAVLRAGIVKWDMGEYTVEQAELLPPYAQQQLVRAILAESELGVAEADFLPTLQAISKQVNQEPPRPLGTPPQLV